MGRIPSSQVDPSRPFSPWLRAVARNAITDSLRSSGRHDCRHQPLKEAEIEAEMAALGVGITLITLTVSVLQGISDLTSRELGGQLHCIGTATLLGLLAIWRFR